MIVMAINKKDIKILWSLAAGRCSFPDCAIVLSLAEIPSEAYTLGEMAHICGDKTDSNRHNPEQTPEERDSYENLILLCPTHHTLIDKKENEQAYSVALLQEFKRNHESLIANRLAAKIMVDKFQVAKAIYPLMQENYQTFINYGPNSDIAFKNPQSDIHSVWLSKRLSVIAPNNRKIAKLIEDNRHLFLPTEQDILAEIDIHIQSYESWVNGEMSYEGVVRFPQKFQQMISELSNAST